MCAHVALIGRSVESLEPLRSALDALTPGADSTTARERVDLYAGFVQSFSLDTPPRYRLNTRGEELLVCGARPPMETLFEGKGDCDSLSMLLATLIAGLAEVDWVLLTGVVAQENHLLVGASVAPAEGDLTIDHEGQTYVLYELTTRGPSTRPSAQTKAHLVGRQFDIHGPPPR